VARRWSDRERIRRIEAAILDWERLELLMHKVQSNLRAAGITQTRVPPPKTILPLLEHATVEYEDELHTMYANLLTAAINPSAEEIAKKYVSVLAEFSAADLRALRRMFAEWQYWEKHLNEPNKDRYSSGITGFPGNDESGVILAYRLGLVLPVKVEVTSHEPGGHDRHGSYGPNIERMTVLSDLAVVAFTEFGERFCAAVMGDVSGDYTPPHFP
jgi:hypothetical protein